jgi:HAD superfamily hydrolase (TIGR01459 family)
MTKNYRPGKRAAPNVDRLKALGLAPDLYWGLLSSGEVTWAGLKTLEDETFLGLGRRCLFFSCGGDRSAVAGLDLEMTEEP